MLTLCESSIKVLRVREEVPRPAYNSFMRKKKGNSIVDSFSHTPYPISENPNTQLLFTTFTITTLLQASIRPHTYSISVASYSVSGFFALILLICHRTVRMNVVKQKAYIQPPITLTLNCKEELELNSVFCLLL